MRVTLTALFGQLLCIVKEGVFFTQGHSLLRKKYDVTKVVWRIVQFTPVSPTPYGVKLGSRLHSPVLAEKLLSTLTDMDEALYAWSLGHVRGLYLSALLFSCRGLRYFELEAKKIRVWANFKVFNVSLERHHLSTHHVWEDESRRE